MMIGVLPEYIQPHRATYKIGRDSFIAVSNAAKHLELANIFVPPIERGNGYATILMICALELASKWKLSSMEGVYVPRGDILKTEKWYRDIGATLEGGLVKGSVATMYQRCQSIKQQYGIEYRLLKTEKY